MISFYSMRVFSSFWFLWIYCVFLICGYPFSSMLISSYICLLWTDSHIGSDILKRICIFLLSFPTFHDFSVLFYIFIFILLLFLVFVITFTTSFFFSFWSVYWLIQVSYFPVVIFFFPYLFVLFCLEKTFQYFLWDMFSIVGFFLLFWEILYFFSYSKW